ncbi:MAG: DNA-deoxyinosine glycosylase [Burkholderiaceae bacterium]
MAEAGRDPDTRAVRGFPPLADARARVLVLGSMPGVASLRAQQYYGHPRNAFWPIMGDIFGFDAAAPYAQRVAALRSHRVAVWDVLAACERPGSLDADIDRRSVEVNDFAGFLAAHPQLRRLCFNGATAQAMFRRHVLPTLAAPLAFDMVRLPSTSPAHAGMRPADKRRAWQAAVLDGHGHPAQDGPG